MSDCFPEMILKTKNLEYLHICCLRGCYLLDIDITNTCIICFAIFKLQDVKMALKMAVIFYYCS